MNLDKHYAPRTNEKREIWSMKMTPKLKYLATLVARADGKTLSGLVEAKLAESLLTMKITDDQEGSDSTIIRGKTVAELSDELYQGTEADRFLTLVNIAPYLVSDGEAKVLRIIRNSNFFSPLHKGYRGLHYSRIRANWDALAAIRDGGSVDLLPENQRPIGALTFGMLSESDRVILYRNDPAKFRSDNEHYQTALKGNTK